MLGEKMANDATNVTVGKPKTSGSVYWAPAGTAAPTDATTALAAEYVHLGYISEDGITQTKDDDTNDIYAWGGDVVITTHGSVKYSIQMNFIESLNPEPWKAVLGSSNVVDSVSGGGFAIHYNSSLPVEGVLVIEMAATGARLIRKVAEHAIATAIDDITYTDGDPVALPATFTAYAGDNDPIIDYIS